MASSRNMSAERDWFSEVRHLFPPRGYIELTSPPTLLPHMQSPSEFVMTGYSTTRTRASTNAPAPRTRHHRSASTASTSLRSADSPNGPLTPPPTPPFNARAAAAQCRAKDGYVSFADIEGLGVPGGEDGELDRGAQRIGGRTARRHGREIEDREHGAVHVPIEPPRDRGARRGVAATLPDRS